MNSFVYLIFRGFWTPPATSVKLHCCDVTLHRHVFFLAWSPLSLNLDPRPPDACM